MAEAVDGATLNGRLLARALMAAGVQRVFCVGGQPNYAWLAVCAQSGLVLTSCRHQQAACLASLAFNYVMGRLASVVVVSPAGGLGNCDTGLLYADAEQWPLLVMAGRYGVADPHAGVFQAMDGGRYLGAWCRGTGLVTSRDAIAGMVADAAALAMSPRPGPVLLEVADAVLSGDARSAPRYDGADQMRVAASGGSDGPNGANRCAGVVPRVISFDQLWQAVSKARRPVLLVGGAARWGEACAVLCRWVETAALPFVTTLAARGFLPDEHPLCRNTARADALAHADLVLLVGVDLDWRVRYGTQFGAGADVVAIGGEGPPAGARSGDGWLPGCLDELLQACVARAGMTARPATVPAACERPRLAGPSLLDSALADLDDCLPEDAVVVLDGNVVMTRAQRALRARGPGRWLTPGFHGVMGVGLPFALGARMALPTAPVVALVGDFSLGLNLLELETAVRLGLPMLIVVARNGRLGNSHSMNTPQYDGLEPVVSLDTAIQYDRVAQVLGAHGQKIAYPVDWASLLRDSAGRAGPTLVSLATDPDELAVAIV